MQLQELYVPDFRTNFLSLAKIVDNQQQVLFIKDHATITERKSSSQAHKGSLLFVRMFFLRGIANKDEQSKCNTNI